MLQAPERLQPMKNTPDRALLERALIAIEQAMASRSAEAHGSASAPTPAEEAVMLCLTSAAALVDVAQTLLRDPPPAQSAEASVREWQALIGHTKTASRTAHQAVLLLSTQRHLVAAQEGVTLTDPRDRAPLQQTAH
ncbi:MAG: hypothetical protein EOP81_07640 [Variovorax sp.]|nr:MAG: hypothetical protein EOP81_07640 [Variovorax sp.]